MSRPRLALAFAALAGALAVSCASAAAVTMSSQMTTAGVGAADAPIVAYFEEKIPSATQVFVNCPKEDGIGIEPYPGEEEPIPVGRGFQCEVRYGLEGEIVKRQDEVEEQPPRSGTYVLVNISHPWKAPETWQACVDGHKPYGPRFVRGKLFVRGEVCGYFGSLVVEAIEAEAYEWRGENLVSTAVPSRFSVGDEEEGEVGFQTERFLCHAQVKPARHSRVRHAVDCVNPFGDAIRMSFETPPPHRHL
jgi:hypothetical protein